MQSTRVDGREPAAQAKGEREEPARPWLAPRARGLYYNKSASYLTHGDRPMNNPKETQTATEVATFAGGCFWCLETVFERLSGVHNVVSGYAGGEMVNPTYRQVCTGTTGHAEAVQVTFDPNVITYRDLLDVFFALHDPTTLNRQGVDVGTQYRSAIFYHSPEQQRIATERIAELNAAGVWPQPIVTEVVPLPVFYRAEDYHQNYYRLNPNQGYCQAVISPKVAKLRKQSAAKLKADDSSASH
jgi:peptide-methionine (S)-S-oxide reductase